MTPDPITLRPGRSSDLDAILTLDRATDTAPHWPVAAYKTILDQTDSSRCLIVAERSIASSSHLTGFAVGVLHPPLPLTAELEDVVVEVGYRRLGIGRQLCVAIVHWAQSRAAVEVTLEVRSTSNSAINLYAGIGFTRQSIRRNYYSNPTDDAVLMNLKLRPDRVQTNSPGGAS